jgi:alpha-tubulin suppressor-like RCC1 family protein
MILDGSGYYYFACGNNPSGQLGTGDCELWETFTRVNLPVTFISISPGLNHNLAIAEIDRSLWSWGLNNFGQLGLGDTKFTHKTQPTQIPNTHSFVQVSAGYDFSLALDSDGRVWSFGDTSYGRIGLESKKSHIASPTQIESLSVEIISISAGSIHGIVLDKSGSLWSFGYNLYGQLGLGDYCSRSSPCKIEGVENIVQISSGKSHNLVLDVLGCVWSFGHNGKGQLGLSDTQRSRIYPSKIPNSTNITQIFAAGDSSIIKNLAEQYFVFGDNQHGQLEKDSTELLSPVEQRNWENKFIVAGSDHTLVIDELGNLFFYGSVGEFLDVTIGKQDDIIVNQRKQIFKRA